jgi:hypothetical protein
MAAAAGGGASEIGEKLKRSFYSGGDLNLYARLNCLRRMSYARKTV